MEHTVIGQNSTDIASLEIDQSELQMLSRLLSKVIANSTGRPENQVTMNSAQRVARAESYYRFRRQRERLADELFGGGLFVDPIWDLLLDLYIQNSRGIEVNVSSACYASYAPATTALRYIAEMENRGMVLKVPDASDRRVLKLKLTDAAFRMMHEIVEQLPMHQP